MWTVVTGASSGIGKALCETLAALNPDRRVLGIARSAS
jgi:NAD(P)-dependent dehydrogenase (short-subunit alcohol dehydrogenase family)